MADQGAADDHVDSVAKALFRASPARQWSPRWEGSRTNRSYYRRRARAVIAAAQSKKE